MKLNVKGQEMTARKRMNAKRILFLIFALFMSQSVSAASFDCAKAQTRSEKIICSNADLSELDEKLAHVYRLARQGAESQDVLTQ